MTEACPKCAYVRQSSDDAPAWQCPKCGIAYARYRELQQKAKERIEAGRDGSNGGDRGNGGNIKRRSEPAKDTRILMIVGLVLVVALAGALIKHALFRPHTALPTETATPVASAPEPAAAAPTTAALPATAAPATSHGDPKLPVDVFKDLFITAHDQGQADSVMMVTKESRGAIGLNVNEPVKVHIDRRETLDMTACNRYGVTLSQGGDYGPTRENSRGQMVKSARTRTTMNFVYSLNYCTDGTTPAGGAAIKVESQVW